jgi:hypothetical protein
MLRMRSDLVEMKRTVEDLREHLSAPAVGPDAGEDR